MKSTTNRTATTIIILLQHFSNFSNITGFTGFTSFIKLMASASSSSSSLADPAPIVFPPPHTFDILPDLHPIVLRLLSAKNPLPGTSQSTSASFTSPSNAVTSQPNQRTAVTPSSVPPPSKAATATTLLQIRGHGHEPSHSHNHSHSQALTPLDAKDLPTATSAIKTRLRGARAVVDTLPDGHRTVAEQEREIAALQARIDRLTRILVEFGRRAKSEREQVQEWEINMET